MQQSAIIAPIRKNAVRDKFIEIISPLIIPQIDNNMTITRNHGFSIKEVYAKRQPKDNPDKAFQKDLKTHNWHNFSYDGYGGFFHTDLFNADKKRMILAMDGFGGQMIVIDFDEERIVVTNAIYNNFHWKKIVREVIKTGKIR